MTWAQVAGLAGGFGGGAGALVGILGLVLLRRRDRERQVEAIRITEDLHRQLPAVAASLAETVQRLTRLEARLDERDRREELEALGRRR